MACIIESAPSSSSPWMLFSMKIGILVLGWVARNACAARGSIRALARYSTQLL